MAQLANLNGKALRTGDAEPALKDGVLRIYSLRTSPYAERIIFWTARKGINAEIVNINVWDARPEWYVNKHPKRQVPSVEYKGKTAYESALLLEYVDELFPESRLLPTDPFEKYQLKLKADKLNNVLEILKSLFAVLMGDEGSREKAYEAAKTGYAEFENMLQDEYFSGPSANLPDYLSYPMFHKTKVLAALGFAPFAVEGFPGAAYPKLAKWFSNFEQLPEVKNNQQTFDLTVTYFKFFVDKQAPDFDVGL